MPFAGYADFNDCVSKNGDKSSPEGFCAWLEHKTTGQWPGQMERTKFPEEFWISYDAALSAGTSEKEAYDTAIQDAAKAGFEHTRFGFIKNFETPKMKSITGVRIFATGKHTDSSGTVREWTEAHIDKMLEAFKAGVPGVVPIKAGHTTDPFNKKIAEALDVPVEVVVGDKGQGQIALGRVSGMNKVDDFLVASFDRVPEQIANLIEGGQFTTVSVEIEDAIGDFGPVITGVALLGAEEPAVEEATLDRALVFGGKREGAQVVSFPKEISTGRLAKVRSALDKVFKGKKEFHTVEERTRYIGMDLGLPEGATLEEVIAELQRLQTEEAKQNKGGKEMSNLPDGLKQKTKEELKGMSLRDIAAALSQENPPNLGDLSEIFQEGDLAAVAMALGLPEGASLEDVLAAIEKMKGGGEEEGGEEGMKGELKSEFSKMVGRVKDLEHDKRVHEWEVLTREFKTVQGTSMEIAIELATLEAKTDKETADQHFTRLYQADQAAAKATERVGTKRIGDNGADSDFYKEVKKYQEANKDATRAVAIEATINAHPDLYHEEVER